VSSTDQQKIISDFLDFISTKMRQTDPWRSLYLEELERSPLPLPTSSEKVEEEGETGVRDGPERAEEEFGLSLEAMEKLVMNRLWHLTFTPAMESEGGAGGGGMSMSGDLERDQVVRQRIRLFRDWLEPKHLDLPIDDETAVGEEVGEKEVEESAEEKREEEKRDESESEKEKEDKGVKVKDGKGKGKSSSSSSSDSFIEFAASELRKMNNYKAPRDKLICVLNCCKVIFGTFSFSLFTLFSHSLSCSELMAGRRRCVGLIRHVSSSLEDQGADTFIPFLIFVVLRANPDHLVSNLQYVKLALSISESGAMDVLMKHSCRYIQRFRNPEKLAGEGGYYLSSLVSS